MTALADALAAAQVRAVAALAKSYMAGRITAEDLAAGLTGIGLTDEVDGERYLRALELLREHGAQPPAETKPAPKPEDETATDAQLALIAKLVKEKRAPAPDLPLSKAQAHEVIDTLKAGTYDPVKWSVPF